MNKFTWTKPSEYQINNYTNFVYTDNPVRNQNIDKNNVSVDWQKYICEFNDLSIGHFNEFGYIGGTDSLFDIKAEKLIISINDHFIDLYRRIDELNNIINK